MMSNKSVANNSTENNLFLDELVQDFDISLSGFGCDNTNVSLIRDLNQVISTLGDNIVKVEAIDNEDNAQDSHDAQVKYFRTTPESPQSNDSCGSYTSTDSDKKFGKNLTEISNTFNANATIPEKKTTTKRLCFKGFSSDELSPISSVSSSMESPNHKLTPDNSDSSLSTVVSQNMDNSYGYAWRRYSKTDAPSVHNKVSSVQIGKTIKSEPERRNFQYILGAPTASGVKIGAMTMTYLNQGQPYEIRLKRIADIPDYDGRNLKTYLRLGFVEKRLQYREAEEMALWCKMHSKDRIIDVDFALSYGIFDVQLNKTNINCLEFVWNPNREASIFVKLNCISTEFTSKRHGGERGTPLRLIIDTHSISKSVRLDAAQCLVKVFKSKGADRKHKTDRERIAKQPDSSLYYQPSYDCTLFTTFNEDDILIRSSSPTNSNVDSPSPKITSSRPSSECPSPHPSVQLNVATSSTSSTTCSQSSHPSEESLSQSLAVANALPSDATPVETLEWLNKNRFHRLAEILMNFSSEDLRRLSREDLIQICGLSDGIRLYNSIHAIPSTTRLTVFVTTDGKVHNAIYLKTLTHEEFKDKLLEALGVHGINISNFYLIGPNDIKIKITDNVVMNMKNESIFCCTVNKDQEHYDLVLQSAF